VEIEAAIADVDRVIAIFNALLRMAEIDTGVRRAGFDEVDAIRIEAEAAQFYHPVAELNAVVAVFASTGAQRLAGDPLLLTQAVGNLIDNALEYVLQTGRIRVGTTRGAGETIEITVADDGPGIPDDVKPRVPERFTVAMSGARPPPGRHRGQTARRFADPARGRAIGQRRYSSSNSARVLASTGLTKYRSNPAAIELSLSFSCP
jgi:K+-sensing histidine kinase KdpD